VRLLRPRRRPLALTCVLVLAIGLVAAGMGATESSDTRPDNPTQHLASPPTTRARPAAKKHAVHLPTPVGVPADPHAWEPEVRLGTIEIPRLGLVDTLYHGVSLTSIDRGPSHWPGTAMPGRLGNVVVAGHRVTHSHPFRSIHTLQPGDEVIFTVKGKRSVYAVTSTRVVTPDETWIVTQHARYTGTLFACHPPGSARFRFVAHLRLVDPSPRRGHTR
jgi:sortase A